LKYKWHCRIKKNSKRYWVINVFIFLTPLTLLNNSLWNPVFYNGVNFNVFKEGCSPFSGRLLLPVSFAVVAIDVFQTQDSVFENSFDALPSLTQIKESVNNLLKKVFHPNQLCWHLRNSLYGDVFKATFNNYKRSHAQI